MKHLQNKVATYDSRTSEWGYREFASKQERIDWLRGLYKLPGEFAFDERVKIFYEQATKFTEIEQQSGEGSYCDYLYNSYDYIEYWEFQKSLCYTGVLIDNEVYITGDHYFYLNFIKIYDKVKKDYHFARFQDLDVWAFYCVELAALNHEMLVILKARQTGFSLKFCARLVKRLWFEKAFAGKMAAYQEVYMQNNWDDIIVPYRTHLNTYTGWTREFELSDKTFNWKQGRKVKENGKEKQKGNRSSLKAYTTQQKASAPVGGPTDEFLYDEAGVSLNVEKVKELMEPALKYGNIWTGNMWILGAAGEMKESESLQRLMYAPVQNRAMAFPNIWSGRPDELVGMFVPYYYAYGDCIDEWGNSDIERAKSEFEKESDLKKTTSFTEYMLFKAQYPATIEDAFSVQEENIFPIEKIQPHYEYLLKHYHETVVTLVDDPRKKTGISHEFGSKTPVVKDWPVKKGADNRGALVVDEFPEEDPPYGLYYVVVDPVRSIKTSTSSSLHSVHVYKAAHRIENEFSEDRLVAWYCGRHDDVNDTFEITKKIIKRWNARAAIESDQASCIEWMVKEKMRPYLMKRSEMPILKDLVQNSQIHEEIGFRTGSGNTAIKEHFYSLIIEYCNEVIGMDEDEHGRQREIFGVTRIKDVMLLKELLNFNKNKGNYDRIISFGAALMVARSNTNRGIMVVKKETPKEPPKPLHGGLATNYKTITSPFNRGYKKQPMVGLRKFGYGAS